LLDARGLRLEAVVVGGSALALLGVITRQTRDVDIIAPELPEEIKEAAKAFAVQMHEHDVELAEDWFNNGPLQLGDVLPIGWQSRVQAVFQGRVLRLSTLGRADLLKAKLFALCDRGTDLADCIALSPTPEELNAAEPWLAAQDAHPEWPDHVRVTLNDLRKRLDDGI
jgi:hypothetical protein